MDYTLKSSMDHLNFLKKLNHFLTSEIVILGLNFDRIEKFLPVFLCFNEGRIFGIFVIQELVAQKLKEGLSFSQYIHALGTTPRGPYSDFSFCKQPNFAGTFHWNSRAQRDSEGQVYFSKISQIFAKNN